ncbi:MAG: DUF1330 domain-containing protein [Pseudomonadota bacterium]
MSDANKLSSYAKLAVPAIEGGSGRFLARASAVTAYEDGRMERTVIIEFDSVDQAIAVHDGAAYQLALAALEGGAGPAGSAVPGTWQRSKREAAPDAAARAPIAPRTIAFADCIR